MTVLRAAGVESESEIPFAGLLDAAAARARTRLDELPPPQADALRGGAGARAGRGRRPLPDRRRDAHAARRVRGAAVRCWWRSTTPSGSTSPRSPRSCSPPAACSPTRSRSWSRSRGAAAPARPARARARRAWTARPPPRCWSATPAARCPRAPPTALFEATLGNPLALVELAAGRRRPRPRRGRRCRCGRASSRVRRRASRALPGPARRAAGPGRRRGGAATWR